jgi:hypothetical protein
LTEAFLADFFPTVRKGEHYVLLAAAYYCEENFGSFFHDACSELGINFLESNERVKVQIISIVRLMFVSRRQIFEKFATHRLAIRMVSCLFVKHRYLQ